ncbi:hypothetical protein PR048_020089 [Dryococelus australis]|uniref:Uncharacterized protein n=1 Tax=Dryococelus australis TaxID=614101 RepID=A0ABQ9H5B2_9NEOP|nr:hypothetical protein PR048_020089 [Dryococelus australis]
MALPALAGNVVFSGLFRACDLIPTLYGKPLRRYTRNGVMLRFAISLHFDAEVLIWLAGAIDLVAEEGRYRRHCYQRFQVCGLSKPETVLKNGRLPDTLRELVEKLAEISLDSQPYSEKHLKRKLTEHYGKHINIHICQANRALFVSLVTDEKEEKKRIIIAAANLIQQEVLSRPYECDFFPTEVGRLNSFISALEIGLGVYLLRRFGFKNLIDLLSNLGIYSSYHEVVRYESSATVHEHAYVQFIYDKADHNVQILNCHHTFHAKGGIKCVTPAAVLKTEKPVPRKSIISVAKPNALGLSKISFYKYPTKLG